MKSSFKFGLALIALALLWFIFLKENLNPSLIAKSVEVKAAQELISQGYSYLDVRTPEEFEAGHVDGAVNVAFILSAGRVKNEHFVEEVSKLFSKHSKIIVGCKSGMRSRMATAELLKEGYDNVLDLAGGYAAWLRHKSDDLK